MTRHNTARLAPPISYSRFLSLAVPDTPPCSYFICSKSILWPSQPESRVGLSIFLQILVVRKRASISTRPTTATAAPPTAGNQGRQIVATCHLHAAHHTQGTPMHWTHGLALLARAGEPCIPSLSLPGRLHALDRHSSDPSLSRVCLPARLPHNVPAWVYCPRGLPRAKRWTGQNHDGRLPADWDELSGNHWSHHEGCRVLRANRASPSQSNRVRDSCYTVTTPHQGTPFGWFTFISELAKGEAITFSWPGPHLSASSTFLP